MMCVFCYQQSSGRMCADCWQKPFAVTSICRIDLQSKFSEKEISDLDDAKMAEIASRMADAYCDNSFRIGLEDIVDQILNEEQ